MEKNKNKEMEYAEAITEVEAILEKFNNEEFDVDTLATQVKRATELIAMCRKKLRKAEEEVAKILRQD